MIGRVGLEVILPRPSVTIFGAKIPPERICSFFYIRGLKPAAIEMFSIMRKSRKTNLAQAFVEGMKPIALGILIAATLCLQLYNQS